MFGRTLRLDPTMADAWYNVGALYDMVDQPEDAQQVPRLFTFKIVQT